MQIMLAKPIWKCQHITGNMLTSYAELTVYSFHIYS